jgi:AraC family transcriptional regulator
MTAGAIHALNQSPRETACAPGRGELAAFFERLGLADDAAASGRGDSEKRSRLYRALTFLEHHLGSRVGMAEIARAACYTPRHFQRVFQEVFGETAGDYIRRLRMQRAAQLLAFHDLPVMQVAMAVSYNSPSVFTRAFTTHHGCPPTEYRARHGAPHRFGTARGVADAPPPLALRFATFPALRIAFIRHIGHPNKTLPVWLKLLAWAWRRNLLRGRAALPLCLYHDAGECPPEYNRCDIALTVPDDFDAADSAVGVKEIPGGMVMMHGFKGTAAAIEARWSLLCDVWLPQSGFKLREPYAFDLFAPHQMAPRKLLAILASGDPVLESTLCVPVCQA